MSQSSANSESDSRFPKPGKRWGQASVSANNCLYIIGGYDGKKITLFIAKSYFHFDILIKNNLNFVGSYLGDVWEFDFELMKFTKMSLEGPDVNILCRSNHTAVYYAPHES